MRMTALVYSEDTHLAQGGTARFSLWELQLSICPLELAKNRYSLRPCLASSYGRLRASGSRTFVPTSDSVAWLEGDLQVQASWQPIGSSKHASAPLLILFIAPAVGIPFKQYSFGFEPYEFHQIPPVILSGIAGIGLRFL
jgi:hypothetical protein